jgi:cullin 2
LEQKASANGAELRLPPALAACSSSFSEFYSNKYSGRRLIWLHHLTRSDVRLHGFDKRYELTVSGIQLALLMYFNDRDRTSLRELAQYLELSLAEVARLSRPFLQLRLLTTESSSLDNDNDVLVVNLSFTKYDNISKLKKLKFCS